MEENKMKKIITAVLSAAVALSSLSALAVNASDDYTRSDSTGIGNIVVLGDSIASGYGLTSREYNYGQILAEYAGEKVDNFAVPGDETDDLLNKLDNPSAELSSAIGSAGLVVISIGGNDLMHYAANYLLNYSADKDVFIDGKSFADVPKEPTLNDFFSLLDVDKLRDFISSPVNQIRFSNEIYKLSAHLRFTEKDTNYSIYDRVIETHVIPNTQRAIEYIRAINSDAEIIVQTIYNPMEFDSEFYAANFQANRDSVLKQFMPVFKDVLSAYRDQLNTFAEKDGKIKVADIYSAFNSDDSTGTQHSWYFTNMQRSTDLQQMDIHPNQKGHLAIAAELLDIVGTPCEDGGLLRAIYNNIDDKDSYPAVAKQTAEKFVGSYTLGDINDDGSIDSGDASSVLKEYASISTSDNHVLTAAQLLAADVNYNEMIGSDDASTILKYYAYLSTGGSETFRHFILK